MKKKPRTHDVRLKKLKAENERLKEELEQLRERYDQLEDAVGEHIQAQNRLKLVFGDLRDRDLNVDTDRD